MKNFSKKTWLLLIGAVLLLVFACITILGVGAGGVLFFNSTSQEAIITEEANLSEESLEETTEDLEILSAIDLPTEDIEYRDDWLEVLVLPSQIQPYHFQDPFVSEYGTELFYAKFSSSVSFEETLELIEMYLQENDWNNVDEGHAYANVYVYIAEQTTTGNSIAITVQENEGTVVLIVNAVVVME